MKLLLDTHFLIWLVNQPDTMERREREVIERATSLHISAASLWELRIKWNLFDGKGRRRGPLAPDEAIRFAEQNMITTEPLRGTDCAVSLAPPLKHRDPFDEMLLVHAQQLGAKLLTRDEKLLGHPLAIAL